MGPGRMRTRKVNNYKIKRKYWISKWSSNRIRAEVVAILCVFGDGYDGWGVGWGECFCVVGEGALYLIGLW